MALITAAEVNTFAFNPAIDPALILPEFIALAEKKYLIPLISRPFYDDIASHPGTYSTLLDAYIKPFLAFYIKYVLGNQSDVEPFIIAGQNKVQLIIYLNSESFPLYAKQVKQIISGFLITNTDTDLILEQS